MTLWTIQPVEWYAQLVQKGTICGDCKFMDPDLGFLPAYRWLMKKMDERIGKRPFPECYPVWAWYQYNGKRKRPDLRSGAFLPRGTKGVRIEFVKNEKEVVLSDFELWHHVLNYWKIDDTEEASNEFDRLLEYHNVEFTDKENYPPALKQMVEQSWNKVLDMDYDPEYAAQPFEKKSIQATFWSLAADEIVKVEEFTARS